jgi:hypothetical protein
MKKIQIIIIIKDWVQIFIDLRRKNVIKDLFYK